MFSLSQKQKRPKGRWFKVVSEGEVYEVLKIIHMYGDKKIGEELFSLPRAKELGDMGIFGFASIEEKRLPKWYRVFGRIRWKRT